MCQVCLILATLVVWGSPLCVAHASKNIPKVVSSVIRPRPIKARPSLSKTMQNFSKLYQKQTASFSLAAQAFRTQVTLPANAKTLVPADSLFIRATHSGLIEKPSISLEQAMKYIQQESSWLFHSRETEEAFLTAFPVLTLESDFIPTPAQVDKARRVSLSVLKLGNLSADSTTIWAKKMSAVTNLGFFGTPKDVPALFQVAECCFSPELLPFTDLILVRAFLNLNQPQAVQQLVDLRLSQQYPSGQLVELSPIWKDIKKYMDQAGHPLIFPFNRVAVHPKKAQLSQAMQQALGRYNAFNLLQADSSVEVSHYWLDLKRGLQEKMFQSSVQTQVIEELAAKPKTPAKPADLPKTKSYTFQTALTPGNNATFQAPAFSQREADAKQALLHLNQIQVQQAQQEVAQYKEQLHQTLPKQFKGKGKGTGTAQEVFHAWEQWYEAQEKLLHAQTHQKFLQASIQDNLPANRISQMAQGYDVLVPPVKTTFHVSRRILVGLIWDNHSFTIPANALSQRDAQLKQALLDEAAREYEIAQENIAYYEAKKQRLHATASQSRYDLHPRSFEYQEVEEGLQLSRTREINALLQQNYIIAEIQHNTPATTIFKRVHKDKQAAYRLDIWQEPKRLFAFQGRGEYPGFTARADTREQAQAKQEVLDYAFTQFEKAKKNVAFVQFEIELERNARPFWKRKQPASQPLQQQLQEATTRLDQARARLEQVRTLIEQETSTADMIYQVYGHKPMDPNQAIRFIDRTAPANYERSFYAKVSSVLDAQVKQEMLDKAAAKYNQAKATLEELQASAASPDAVPASDYQAASRALRAAYIEMGVTRSEIEKMSSLKTIHNAVQKALEKEGLLNP